MFVRVAITAPAVRSLNALLGINDLYTAQVYRLSD